MVFIFLIKNLAKFRKVMDFALDTSETPSRAFTLDVIEDVGTRQSAFNIQQFYVGIGGVAGNWKKKLY